MSSSSSFRLERIKAEDEEEDWGDAKEAEDIGKWGREGEELGDEKEAAEIGKPDISLEWDGGGGRGGSSFSSDITTNTEELVDWPIFESF